MAPTTLLGLVLLLAGDPAAATSPAPLPPTGAVPPVEERPQFVLFCFDATPVWGDTLEDNNIYQLLTEARAARPESFQGPDPTITVFINTGFLQVSKWHKPKKGTPAHEKGPSYYKPYRAHPKLPGTKVLGYAPSVEWILERAERIKTMHAMGVEVASHGVMHLNGKTWTRRDWDREFDEHQRVLDLLGLPVPTGYRAPFLATGRDGPASLRDPLFQVLHARGFRYDSSKAYTRGPRWPRKVDRTSIWEVPIETTFIDGKRQIMFTDYGTDDEKKHHRASMKEFRKRYEGERAPIILGGHGEHMRSNLRLMKEICYLDGVRCGTFSELVAYMDAHPELSAYRGTKRPVTTKRARPRKDSTDLTSSR